MVGPVERVFPHRLGGQCGEETGGRFVFSFCICVSISHTLRVLRVLHLSCVERAQKCVGNAGAKKTSTHGDRDRSNSLRHVQLPMCVEYLQHKMLPALN